MVLVHRIIAKTFIQNPNNYPIVNHKDGNGSNNCVDNLEWCNKEYNIKHAVYNDLLKYSKNPGVQKYKYFPKDGVQRWRANCTFGMKKRRGPLRKSIDLAYADYLNIRDSYFASLEKQTA